MQQVYSEPDDFFLFSPSSVVKINRQSVRKARRLGGPPALPAVSLLLRRLGGPPAGALPAVSLLLLPSSRHRGLHASWALQDLEDEQGKATPGANLSYRRVHCYDM